MKNALLIFCGLLVGTTYTQAQVYLSIEDFKQQSDEWIATRDFEQALNLAYGIDPTTLSPSEQETYYLQMQEIYAPHNALNFDSVVYYIDQVIAVTAFSTNPSLLYSE